MKIEESKPWPTPPSVGWWARSPAGDTPPGDGAGPRTCARSSAGHRSHSDRAPRPVHRHAGHGGPLVQRGSAAALEGLFMSTSNVLSPVSPSGESEIQSRLVLPDELTFTIVTASNRQPLGKRYWMGGSGEVQTETAVPLASGEVTVDHASSITAFAERLIPWN